jgi:hypothetical protein
VLDAETAEPVTDVEVVFADGTSEASVTSDVDGGYTIEVPPGRYRPFVRSDGVLSVGKPRRKRLLERPQPEQIAASTLALAPGLAVFHDLSRADLEVVRSAVILGRVLDRAGHPIAGAMVQAGLIEDDGGQSVLGTDVDEADADGRFRLAVAAKAHQLEAFHDHFGASETRPIVDLKAGHVYNVDLTMIAGCIIAGRVVGDGIPPGDGAIERASSADNPDAFGRAGSFTSDGRFRWSTDEETAVTLRATPWKAPSSAPRTFECRDGKRYDDVVFEIPRTSADLAGSIVTASGTPAAMAFIDVHGLSPGTTDAQERADGDGTWEVFGLPPGDYVVVSRVPGQGIATARATAPGRGTVLTLSGTGSLVGTAKGMEEGAFSLEVDCVPEFKLFGETSEQFLVSVHGNSYQVDGLPACKAKMVARNSVWRTPSHEVDVPAGGVATTDLDLTPLVTKEVYGLVRDRLERPVDGAVVSVPEQPGVRTVSGPDGRFTIRAPASASILVAGEGAAMKLDVPDGAQPMWDVDVPLEHDLDQPP